MRSGRGLVAGRAGGRIVEVEALAAADIAAQIVEIVDRANARLIVEMRLAVAPVRQRPIDVDADRVDGARGPQRIEVEIDVAAFRPAADARDARSSPPRR